MHDIHTIRQDPVAFDQLLGRRNLSDEDRKRFSSEQIISIDERRRAIIRVREQTLARRNALSKEIGVAKGNKDEAAFQQLMAQVEDDKASITRMDEEQKAAQSELDGLLAQIPNLPLPEVPEGKDEKGNVEHHRFGAKREFVVVRKGGRITSKARDLIVYMAQSGMANTAVAQLHGISSGSVARWLQKSKNPTPKPNLEPADVFTPKQHFELGETLELMDFEAAAKLSGARFVVLRRGLARMERALGQFFLDVHTSEPHNYAEIAPPLLVRDEVMFGTAQLPKFEDDQFHTTGGRPADRMLMSLVDERFKNLAAVFEARSVPQEFWPRLVRENLAFLRFEATKDYRWLIPTAEVPLTNLVRESIVDEAQLPMRFTACTPCFRAEAGAAGKDTRGMIRQHQFTKVELVSITTPEQSKDEHERMLSCAEEVLKRLDLHYRVITLCTGDMGFASQKTYDIEVWLPGQNAYREISSCSVCGDFQARRMNARYRTKEGRQVRHVHTLNGSGVAVGRALIAVMETYQQEDGSIAVPDVLLPYMGGMTKIEKRE